MGKISLALALVVASLLLAASAGCGGAEPAGGAEDGGRGFDAGLRLDGGIGDGGASDGGEARGDGGFGDGGTVDGGVSTTDGGSTGDGGTAVSDGGAACVRALAAADRERVVVVSHPYSASGGQASVYEALRLSASGTLTRASPVASFTMGRANEHDVVFTPDGEIGLVAQDDGSIGVFRMKSSGAIEVVQPRFREGFYADSIAVSADGTTAYILDANFPENGGGLYRAQIGCDGRLRSLGKWLTTQTLRGLVLLPSGERLLAARSVEHGTTGDDLHRLAAGDVAALTGGVDAFGDDEASISSLVVSGDSRYALVADNSVFSGIPQRIAVAALVADGGLSRVWVISPIQDPVALVFSPFNDAVLVASGEGNALLRLRYDPASRTPFTNAGAIAYRGARPALPANMVVLTRGALRGRVLVSENLGVRQVQFGGDGGVVTDLGVTPLGTGFVNIVGIVGVQP